MKIDQNTVALVTGGASGLGEATARLLHSMGAKVFIFDMNEGHSKAILSELGPERFQYAIVDVSCEESVKAGFSKLTALWRSLHIVVNSAGVLSAGFIISNKGEVLSSDEMLRVLKINVIGTFNITKYASQIMHTQPTLNEQKERGVIINVASVAGFEGQKGQSVYSASKGAILGMTLPLARDLGKYGIRVATIAPGVFETPMGGALPEKFRKPLESSSALNRLGVPSEFAQFAVSIAQNGFLTGACLRLDGGIRLGHF